MYLLFSLSTASATFSPIHFLFLLFLTTKMTAADTTLSIEKAFTENDIVADVLSGKGPYKFLELKFKGGLDVELGNQLTPTQASQQPQVDWDASADRLYTLAMVDPDAPSRANPVNREWLHWLVVNIPGSQVEKGRVLVPYKGPAPPRGSGPHRYVVLVYDQRGRELNVGEHIADIPRGKWSIDKFAKQQELGNPVAGNFFLSDNP